MSTQTTHSPTAEVVPRPAGAAHDRRAPALRPYQQDIVAAVHQSLAGGGIGQIRMACGSGKTIVGQRAAERLLPQGGTVALLAPSLALIAQTLTAWKRNAERDFEALAVCSDDSVADSPVHTGDLPVPVTTSQDEITGWLRRPGAAGLRLVLCTYASAARLADAVTEAGPLDLVVFDEAHHMAERADYAIRQILSPARLPARRRLFMTATPRVDLRETRTEVGGGTVPMIGMDDHTAFGPVLGDYPFARGIAEGYLEDYRIAVIGVRDSQARALLAERGVEYVDAPGGASLRTAVAQVALGKAREQFGISRVLAFHPKVDDAAEFSRALPGVLRRAAPDATEGLHAGHVHGGMPSRVRERILGRLREVPEGGWTVISNARCLGEGVDVPAVDAVLFAHPKKSAVDIGQAVGRALRRDPLTPGPATIIVPLVVPEQDEEIGDLEPGDYATLWQVVRALRGHDKAFGAALDSQRSHATVSNPSLPDKITVVLPPGVSQGFLADLKLLLVRQTTSPWWEGYHAAAAYYEQRGDLLIPAEFVNDQGVKVGSWIAHRRSERRAGVLSPDRVELLDALGMVWRVDLAQERWDLGIAAARAYRAGHGDLFVPKEHVTDDGHSLGAWIGTQRQKRRRGELSPEQISELESLGMVWDQGEARWQQMYGAARVFHDRHGHLDVPHAHATPDGLKLGSWVLHQRQLHSGVKPGGLSEDRRRALDQLGMRWK